ncbi:MFS transporter [Alicyclobacillus dauci]|uniref:MFS transporter n=1 Tax=Alicyclobacillus dauci TaxID=1475485 RepID=A0ABY6YYI5_9BACL|nr:MFS transporter [Alicyclobacillus dauci]WAH35685.1 MFS transporter [Alicyclobacillus dauci]
MSTVQEAGIFGGQFTPEKRRSIFGGWLAGLLNTYDLFLPVLVLPTAMGYFEPSTLSPVVQVTLINIAFAISMVAQPVGGLFIGPIGDRIGRKRLVVLTSTGFTIGTLLLAIMPGYAAMGYWAIGIFFFLRLVNGAFAAAGLGGSVPLALERTPKRWRGLVGGLLGVAPTTGIILLSAVQLIMDSAVTPQQFVAWGWRVPFLVGVVLGAILIVFINRVSETELFAGEGSEVKTKTPIREVFSARNIKTFGQMFVLYSGYLFAIQVAVSFVPSLMINILHQPPKGVESLMLYGNVGIIVAGVLLGAISQKIGRRRALMLGGGWIFIVSTILYYLTIHAAKTGAGFGTVGVLGFLVIVLTVAPFSGMVLTYTAERYPMHTRSTGFSAVSTLTSVIPGFYSFYLLGLGKMMPYEYTILVLCALAGFLTWIGAKSGPETVDIDMVPDISILVDGASISGD